VIDSRYYLEVVYLVNLPFIISHPRLFCFCFLFVVAAVLANKDVYKTSPATGLEKT